MKNRITLIVMILALVAFTGVQAQEVQQFSLKQSIEYALKNRNNLKIARNEQDIAKAKVGEIRAMGLPQIDASAEVGNNFIRQKTLFDPELFGGGPALNPFVITPEQIASGETITLTPTYSQPGPRTEGLIAVSFVQPYAGSLTFSGSQLLFDGSYLIGLKAAKTYTELSRKSTIQSEIEVAELVSKAYYSVLVSRERIELLNQNLARLDTLLKQTQVMFENGVAEKLDVDRLQVQLNNLAVQKQRTERLLTVSVNQLKFQMGMDHKEQLVLTDKLSEVEVDLTKTDKDNFNYSSRIEYSLLETQHDLANLDLRNKRSGYLPKLSLNARYGYNGVGSSLSDVLDVRAGQDNTTDRNYFDFGYVGVQLTVPVFDGLRKHYQIQQSKLTLENAKLDFQELEESIDLQLDQATAELTSSLEVMRSQQENMELAQEIARVAKIKFQEGVGSNLEVVTAETDLREAQTNYYAAMFDALISKVNLDKATGTLLTK